MKNDGGTGNVPLWLLVVPIGAWALHFLGAYVVAAVYCAKSAAFDTALSTPISAVRWTIVAITFLTLAITAAAARRGHAGFSGQCASGVDGGPDQNRFLGSIALLLCALSAAAMLFVSAVTLFFGDCR